MKIIKLNAIDSTNNYLLKIIRNEPVEDITVVAADDQQNGRGQRDKRWVSNAQKSLTFSMFKRFDDLPIKYQYSISMAVSLGIKRTLDDYGIPNVTIKWPNDIMSYSKKLAGILIENQSKGSKVISSVIGVGMNVNEDYFEDLPQATSLFLSSGNTYSIKKLLIDLSFALEKELDRLNRKDLISIHREFEQYLFRKGEFWAFKGSQFETFKGCIQGVSKSGELKIECEDGKVRRFRMQEIEYVF